MPNGPIAKPTFTVNPSVFAMMKLLLPGLAVIAMLTGCAGESLDKKVLGKWTVDMTKTEMSGERMKKEEDKKMMTDLLKTVTLDLKEDKKFEMEFLLTLKGTWALQGNKVILTPDAAGGSISFAGGKKTMDFEANSAGTEMTLAAETPDMKGKLVLVKPATP